MFTSQCLIGHKQELRIWMVVELRISPPPTAPRSNAHHMSCSMHMVEVEPDWLVTRRGYLA